MKRTLYLLLILTLVAGSCKKNDPDSGKITFSAEEVLLGSQSGAETSVTLQAQGPWNLAFTGPGFTVSPLSGGKGTTSVSVTATAANPGNQRLTLGTITVRSGIDGKEYTLPVAQSSAVVPQTVVMYLPWSGNLYDYFLNNIEDAKKAIAGNILGDSRLLVFLQTNANDATLRELYYEGGKCRERTLKTYSGINVTQAATITGILRDVTDNAPAQHYAMTIGSHGMAWIPAPGSRSTPYGVPAIDERPHWEYVSPDGQFTRWFGDGNIRSTNTTTLAEAITAAGITMQYILFDDCFMSSIEVAYDLRKVTKYLICSPCEVMAFGYPYDLVLPQMFTDGGTDYSIDGICRTFYDFYEQYEAPNYNCGAIAVTVCSEMERMAAVMKRINTTYPLYTPEAGYELQRYEYLYNPTRFFDYGDYVSQLCKDKVLLTEFEQQLERTVPARYRLHTESYYSNGKRLIRVYSGISTSDPSTSSSVTAYITGTAWYAATH